MGILELLEDEYVDVSSGRASLRELLELIGGSMVFVLAVAGLAVYLVGETAAIVVAGVLTVVFAVTILSQTYWAVAGRADYGDAEETDGDT